MDEKKTKKYIVIALTVVSLGVAGFMAYRTFFSIDGGSGNGNVAIICKSCGGFEISSKELHNLMTNDSGDMMMEPGQLAAMQCPKCKQKTASLALKCQKCGTFYVLYQAKDPRYPNRCPQCRYSATEERVNSLR